MRLKTIKLAASPVLPLKTKSRFRNELLLDQTWPQDDVNYLRDTYNDIVLLWEELKEPETDKLLYQRTEPKLQELVVSLMDVVDKVQYLPSAKHAVTNARYDLEGATMYRNAGDFASATLYQSYSLAKIHDVLEALTRFGSTPARQRMSSFIEKTARPSDAKLKLLQQRYKLRPAQMELIIAADPTPFQSDYVAWIAKQYAKKAIRLPEDTNKIKEQLDRFTKLKRSPAFNGDKDIQKYTPEALFNVLLEDDNDVSKKQQIRDLVEHGAEGAFIYFIGGGFTVYEVTDPEKLAILSSNTNWCTTNVATAAVYVEEGKPNYVTYDKGQPLAQFDFDSMQFMDRFDVAIDATTFFQQRPILAPVFLPIATDLIMDDGCYCEDCGGFGTIDCPSCNGGLRDSTCSDCGGSGSLLCTVCEEGKVGCTQCGSSGTGENGEPCEYCNGTGKEDCDSCNGNGYVSCDTCAGTGEEQCQECGDKSGVTCEYCNGTGKNLKLEDFIEGCQAAMPTMASRKKAYGYDISGEVFEGSGETAMRENEKNINDTAQPQDHHETAPNPANLMHDVDADKEFPELLKKKTKRVSWPPRSR